MEVFRALYLIGGVLFLSVSVLGGAWWEFILGEPSRPVLYLGLSPFGLEIELLGSQVVKAPPVLNALFFAERALAVLGASTIIVGALLRDRPWFRRLLNLRPFTTPVGFAVFVVITTLLLPRYLSTSMPLLAQLAPNFAEALVPYASGRLRLDLYSLTHINGSLDLSLKSWFTPSFWVALLSGALCLIGRILIRKTARGVAGEVKPEVELPPPPTDEQQVDKKA